MIGYHLRMPPTLKSILEENSQRTGISVNALILQVLWEYVERKKIANEPLTQIN